MLHVLLLLACLAPIERGSASATRGGLDALSEPASLEMLDATTRALLRNPEVEAATRRLALAFLETLDERNQDPARAQRMQERSAALVEALAPAMAEALRTELGPAAREEMTRAITETLQDPQVRRDVGVLAVRISAAVRDTLLPALGPEAARAMTEDLGPALETLLRQNLMPVLTEQLEPLSGQVAGAATKAMLQELTLALDGELGAALERRQAQAVDDLMTRSEGAARAWTQTLGMLVALLGLAVLALATGWRRSAASARDRLAAMELLTSNIKQAEDREMARKVRDSGKETPGGEALSAFLRERKHLKIEVGEEG